MSAKRPGDSYPPASLSKEQLDLLSAQGFVAPIYVDLSSNSPKSDEKRREFRSLLRDKFELNLSDTVERIWQLPPVMLTRGNDEYVRLLVEARDLFMMGFFYSCVAMCGIVGEKLVKDLGRVHTMC